MPRITVNNLHKDFKIYERPQDRLWEIITRKPRHRLYHVLSDISFALPDGQSLGIIGVNGAGKSTLLKLLVGTLQPTSGEISIEGQVAALLELGAGFHPEFTGRKNIYLNAALAVGPGNLWTTYVNDESEEEKVGIRPVVNARGALGYNGNWYFMGITAVNQFVSSRVDNLDVNSKSANIKLFFGIKFKEKGLLKKELL